MNLLKIQNRMINKMRLWKQRSYSEDFESVLGASQEYRCCHCQGLGEELQDKGSSGLFKDETKSTGVHWLQSSLQQPPVSRPFPHKQPLSLCPPSMGEPSHRNWWCVNDREGQLEKQKVIMATFSTEVFQQSHEASKKVQLGAES